MPETREIDNLKAKEIIALMDKLADLTGASSFTSQLEQIIQVTKSQRSTIKENTSLTDTEVDQMLEQLPNLMADTVSQAFNALSASMQQVLSDPEKMKQALKTK